MSDDRRIENKVVRWMELIFPILVSIVGFAVVWGATRERLDQVACQTQANQTDIAALKTSEARMSQAVADIKDQVQDIHGDMKELLRRVK